MLVLIKIQNVL